MKLQFRVLAGILIALITSAVLAALAIVSLYRFKFGGLLSESKSEWGSFGDYVGGTLNPLFALLSFFALSTTLIFQWFSIRATQREVSRAEFMRRFEIEEGSLEHLAMDMVKNLLFYVEWADKEEGEREFNKLLEHYSKGEKNIFINKLKAFFVISQPAKVDQLMRFADCGYGLQAEQYVHRYNRLLADAKKEGQDIHSAINYRITAKLFDSMLPHYIRHQPSFKRGDA